MKGLRVDVYLVRGTEERRGECAIACPDSASEMKLLLRRLTAQIISDIESSLANGKCDCGLYLEIFAVPPALEAWFTWREICDKSTTNSLITWKENQNGRANPA